jgi:hypothetical protein
MPPLESVDVILRSSPDTARSTVDIFEIWQGELIFQDVDVGYPRRKQALPLLPPDRA